LSTLNAHAPERGSNILVMNFVWDFLRDAKCGLLMTVAD